MSSLMILADTRRREQHFRDSSTSSACLSSDRRVIHHPACVANCAASGKFQDGSEAGFFADLHPLTGYGITENVTHCAPSVRMLQEPHRSTTESHPQNFRFKKLEG